MWVEEVEGVEDCRELYCGNQMAGPNSGDERWGSCKEDLGDSSKPGYRWWGGGYFVVKDCSYGKR